MWAYSNTCIRTSIEYFWHFHTWDTHDFGGFVRYHHIINLNYSVGVFLDPVLRMRSYLTFREFEFFVTLHQTLHHVSDGYGAELKTISNKSRSLLFERALAFTPGVFGPLSEQWCTKPYGKLLLPFSFWIAQCAACQVKIDHNCNPRHFKCWSRELTRKCWQTFGRISSYTPISRTKYETCCFFHYLFHFNVSATLLSPFIFPAPWHPEIDRFWLWLLQKFFCTGRGKPCHGTNCLAWSSLAWSIQD